MKFHTSQLTAKIEAIFFSSGNLIILTKEFIDIVSNDFFTLSDAALDTLSNKIIILQTLQRTFKMVSVFFSI